MRDYKKRRLLIGIATFFIPIIILIVLFAHFQITPFGNHSLIVADFNNQYLSYFVYLKHNFFNIHKLLYSYSLSLGGNFFGVTTYYLLSPFNLLFLIFPVSQFPAVITFITTLKIGCLAITMYFYLNYLASKYHDTKRKQSSKYDSNMISLLSISFSLMSFVINYKSNIMWLDSIVLLPLVMLGLEQILDNKRPYLYIGALFFSIVLNYYVGFIICLFTGLFFVYRLSLFEKRKGGIKGLYTKVCRFVIASGIGGALSAFILLPSFESVRLNGTAPYAFGSYLRFSPLDILPMLLSNVAIDTSKLGLPSVSCGLLVIILVGLYFLSNRITVRERMTSFVFLLLLLFSQSILGTYLIWHGLTAPHGFPDRNAFIFPFVFIYLAFRAWCYSEKWSAKILSRLFVFYVIGILILFKCYGQLVTTQAVLFDLLLGGLIIGSIYLLQSSSVKIGFVCLTVVCLFDVTLNAYHWQKLPNYSLAVSQFKRYYSATQNIVDKIKSKDATFYRMGMTFMRVDTDPLMFNYVGLSNYNSADNITNVHFLSRIGYFQNYSYWRWMNYNNGATLGMDSLLGVKYLVTNNHTSFNQNFDEAAAKMGARNQMNHAATWQPLNLKGSTQYQVYKNPLALSLVNLVNSKVIQTDLAKSNNVFETQNQIFDALNQQHNNIYQVNKIDRIGTNKYQVTIKHSGNSYAYLPVHNQSITSYESTQAILLVNGKKIRYGNQAENGIVRLGHFKKGQQVSLEIRPQGKTSQKQFNLIYQKQPIVQSENKQRLIKILKKLKREAPVASVSETKISFEANGSKEKVALLTLPYDASWHAVSNGHPVKLKKSFNNLITVPLKDGKQKVTLSFSPLGLKKGLLISFGGCVGLMIFGIYDEKKRRYIKEGLKE